VVGRDPSRGWGRLTRGGDYKGEAGVLRLVFFVCLGMKRLADGARCI
jgi:hypothetical protein